ncbi:hypothetical protein ACFW5P_25725 [Streptomyces rochei]|uniref:hypothetical protein n=1 Tax=Streptomyces rochei TaxID=1928 RepID=UPI0036A7D596
MAIDWIAEAQRLAYGRRFDEFSSPASGQDSSPTPLPEAQVCEAEAGLGVVFPVEYREYLLRQSAGGAMNRLRRSAAGWGWQGDSSTNYDLLTIAFPHPDSNRAYEDELDARESLEENFPDHDAYQQAWKQWDAVMRGRCSVGD